MTTTDFDNARNDARAQAADISRLMTALEVDYDQLEELKDTVQNLRDELVATLTELDELDDTHTELDELNQLNARAAELTNDLRATTDEWADLRVYAGDFTDRDAVETELDEYPLSVELRSDWVSRDEPLEATEYAILLSTGGPAARIRGELNEYGTPTSAWMEAQDWGTPWVNVYTIHDDALLEFAQFTIPN